MHGPGDEDEDVPVEALDYDKYIDNPFVSDEELIGILDQETGL